MPTSKLLRVAGLILILLLTLVGQGQAQDQQPPRPPHSTLPTQPTSIPPSYPAVMDNPIVGDKIPAQPVPEIGSQAIMLGDSGLSFRYVQTYGVTEEPYAADSSHLNAPNGLFMDGSDAIYVVEEIGQRLLKYDASGTNTLILGHAGYAWHNDDFLSWPKDVAVDGAGNIWALFNPAVKKFDATGSPLLTIPDTNPWEVGDDDYHFNDPRGIAFDGAGRLFVSDTQNHRIQVYDVSGGSPTYVLTIGVTGERKVDNSGFSEPAQIAFDISGRLYVMDTANYRIQRCTKIPGPPETWTCSTFYGVTGVSGSDLSHLSWAYGITIRSDNIFIADSANYRVLKCNTAGPCSLFAGVTGVPASDNTHFLWPADAAIDSAGNVYVSDNDNYRIQKFNSTGVYLSTIGVTGVPYVTDTIHLNKPWGIAVAPDGSFYVTENRGYRLVKFNASGTQLWAVGQAGVFGSDNAHFGNWWTGPEGSPAIDASGHVYVGDTGNDRLQIFNSNSSYYATLGSYGTGNYEFSCPSDVAINPVNGDIYVADKCNQRVQVFTSGLVFKATLGATGTSGSDNLHFINPWGVTLDSAGNIYVADSDNHRIQKCILIAGAPGYACSTFAGETGVSGIDFGHLAHPLSAKVDVSGRVYVADEWNNRIQVFDTSGAYLTTIGGSWGSTSGDMMSPSGVALDGSGNVYVADRDNHRLQKFAPGVPGWRQSNINGFGVPSNYIYSLSTFNGQMYAGTLNGNGAQIWRSANGQNWSQFTPPWTATNDTVFDMEPFGSYLYAGTWNSAESAGGEIWRTDGLTWSQVVNGGFGDTNNSGISSFVVFSNTVYAATSNSTTGLEIWHSINGNSGSWTQVNTDGFGYGSTSQDTTMDVYDGSLYVGIGRNGTAELWKTDNGLSWTHVFTNGLATNNTHVSAMAEFNGYFYIGLRNVVAGGEVWSSTDGINFSPVIIGGLGNSDNLRPYGLYVFAGHLYLVFSNLATGAEVWRTATGSTWERVSSGGWGDRNNGYTDYFDKGATVLNNRLFIGTQNVANGGEIWQMLHQIYLPLVIR